MRSELQVLVTGKNRRMALEISEQLMTERGYNCYNSVPEKDTLIMAVSEIIPDIIIICTFQEEKDDIMQYEAFSKTVVEHSIAVFVIAGEKEKNMFKNYSTLNRIYFVDRPLNLFTLYEKLTYIEDKKALLEKGEAEFLGEYNNPNGAVARSKKRILVVDDDSQQLSQIKDLLDEFYDVSLVKSGESAIKLLSKKEVDLILLDYEMPKMNGPEVFRRLRSNIDTKSIPIVFLTGVTDKSKIMELATDYKPEGYVVKPAKKSKLVAQIIDILG